MPPRSRDPFRRAQLAPYIPPERLRSAELEERCPVTELLRNSCACKQCRNIPDPPEVTRQLGPWLRARYRGRCAECDQPYVEGDRIRRLAGRGYVTECCGEDDPDV